MRVGIVTSEKSVSLQKVARDVGFVLEENGFEIPKVILSPVADPFLYEDLDAIIVVMTFDTFWATPYFYLCWRFRREGRKCIFYTTIEGYPMRWHGDVWIYRDLDFVANSRYTASRIEKVGGRIKAVVYHGIDLGKPRVFSYKRREIRESLGVKEDEFVVLYVAGDYPRKGHDLFAAVAKIVGEKDKKVKFVVLTQSKAIKHYVGLDNVIVLPYFGKVGEDYIYGLYHAADLYAQPSLCEGFGLPVLEALACGKPVVHADYEPLSEITTPQTSFRVRVVSRDAVQDVGGIIFEYHYYDPKEFADAILYAKDEVLRDPEEWKARCMERAKEFDRNKVYRKFVELLQKG